MSLRPIYLPAKKSGDLLPPVPAKDPIFPVITSLDTFDVRFPTSRDLDGSDAMNPDPDYSAAYTIIRTDAGDGLEGHGFAFTIGRGNDVQVAAIRALEPFVVGLPVEQTLASMGDVWRSLVHDSQLRWLGPEKGVMHMGIAAVVNALWDLAAKRAGKPLWQLLAEMSPEQLVELVDFRYITDALKPDEALEILTRAQPGREQRTAQLLEHGYPAYTTTPGWLGYSDAKLARLCQEAVQAGYDQVKLKVGGNLEDDVRRMRNAREACGAGVRIAVDANQRWDVEEAVRWIRALEPHDPWWVEEPTSPDDVLGHAAIRRGVRPVRIATGEHVQNRVVFKQLMQAQAIDIVQIDAARVAGVRALRDGPAPGDVRLHRRLRHARGSRDRVRGPPARALRRSGRDPGRPLSRPGRPGDVRRADLRRAHRPSVPRRSRLGRAGAAGMTGLAVDGGMQGLRPRR